MRRKMFLILFASLSIVFFSSYCLNYVLFRSILLEERQREQTSLANYNTILFAHLLDSFNSVPFQLINDATLGTTLNTDSPDSLDMFRAKEDVRQQFARFLQQQFFSSDLNCRFFLFLNENTPLYSYVDPGSLTKNRQSMTCQLYTDTQVSDMEWYHRTLEST